MVIAVSQNYRGAGKRGEAIRGRRAADRHSFRRGRPAGPTERFDEVMALVQRAAQNIYLALKQMPKPSMPNENEVKFGLALTAEAGVVLAMTGNEGTFEITLRWRVDKYKPEVTQSGY